MTVLVRRDDEFTHLLKLNLRSRYNQKRRSEDEVHVSDIIPSSCIRKQYYSRRFPEIDTISDESIFHFIRGESSEFIITQLANIGVSQANLEFDGILAHPDIMSNDAIVELKDTLNSSRLNLSDEKFRSYLRQLLYYLVITGVERGVISIRYNTNEMVRRKNLFRKALERSDVSILPRLSQAKRNLKCTRCNFYNRCMNEDDETAEAREMANEIDVLDISGVIDFRPFQSE